MQQIDDIMNPHYCQYFPKVIPVGRYNQLIENPKKMRYHKDMCKITRTW